jgi:tRNA modification GTPase
MIASTRFSPDDTIVALSSAAGPGERAIIRLSGSRAMSIVDSLASFDSDINSRSPFTSSALKLPGVYSALPVMLHRFIGPRSYTGQDIVEIHTCSSAPLIEQLITALLDAGARSALPGEFTQRAFLAGKLDLPRAEAVRAVIHARTETDLEASLAQLAGNVSEPLSCMRSDLLDLLADVEAGLDFVGEDIEFVTPAATLTRIAAGLAHLVNLKRQFQSRTVSGRNVTMAIVGTANAGKSSLFNALIGSDAAIVSPVAGTTRDWLTATVTIDGVPIDLIDTAGLGLATSAIDATAQSLGQSRASQADLLLWCVAADTVAGPRPVHDRVLKITTKADLINSHEPGDIRISTLTGDGLTELRAVLGSHAQSLTESPLAPSQSRCGHHVQAANEALLRAHEHALNDDPAELLAMALREAIDAIGAMVGAVYTNDLLDRVFSRFCIGK